ncbi:MAG TPA: hypothetical protein VFS36_11430 [Chitinophagaceae bacterium]|jgi:DNA-binding CsgD family transcriptional regulator|nr:hypothetical protein [Chitinophagaceae bacterium]
MMIQTDLTDFDLLKDYVTSLYPAEKIKPKVSLEKQETELRSLKQTIGSERFYFVVDLRQFEISDMAGVQKWLGYYEKEFTLRRYWTSLHPGLQKLSHAVFREMIQVVCTGSFKLEFMVQRYSSLVALKHYKGNYLLAKRTASVFQYDYHNRLLEYLNEFTIIGDYNGESLNPKFFTDKGENEKEKNKLIMDNVRKRFRELKVFSIGELQVARALAYNQLATQQEIAESLGKSPHTIDTYCKRFLKKARDYFHVNFSTVAEAAKYVRKAGLL